jgi:hypothetical protein
LPDVDEAQVPVPAIRHADEAISFT